VRKVFLVTYDIRDPRRLRLVYKKMRGFGDHIQYSVFRCHLTPSRKVRMIAELSDIIDHECDQILLFDLGPESGFRADSVEALGQTCRPPDHEAIIV
jgi:CRISPR-associated protein Cas2